MDTYREQMQKYYYVPSKYDTYLEQLGIKIRRRVKRSHRWQN